MLYACQAEGSWTINSCAPQCVPAWAMGPTLGTYRPGVHGDMVVARPDFLGVNSESREPGAQCNLVGSFKPFEKIFVKLIRSICPRGKNWISLKPLVDVRMPEGHLLFLFRENERMNASEKCFGFMWSFSNGSTSSNNRAATSYRYQGLQQFWMYFLLGNKGISIKLLTTSQSMCSCCFLLFEISHSTSIFRPVKNPSWSMWTPCQTRQNGWIFLLSTNLMGPEIHKSTLFSNRTYLYIHENLAASYVRKT